jgi:hypothetical protein
MQLLLINDAVSHSLINSCWNNFIFLKDFFYFILRHLRHFVLRVKLGLVISHDKCLKFASFCVIDLSCENNDYIYSPTN